MEWRDRGPATGNRALPDNSTREYQLATGFQIPHSKFQRIRSGLEVGIWNLEFGIIWNLELAGWRSEAPPRGEKPKGGDDL
jgi:hypothetical protein